MFHKRFLLLFLRLNWQQLQKKMLFAHNALNFEHSKTKQKTKKKTIAKNQLTFAKQLRSILQTTKPQPVESLSDDFLFPMTTSRLSYASSPESDLELSPGPSASLSLGNLPQLVKASSDPSIATNQDNLDRDRDIIGEGLPPPYTVRGRKTNQPNKQTNKQNKKNSN